MTPTAIHVALRKRYKIISTRTVVTKVGEQEDSEATIDSFT